MFGVTKGVIFINSGSSDETTASPYDNEPKNAEGVLMQIIQAQMIEESKAEQSACHTEKPPTDETKIEPSPRYIPGKAIEPNQERTTE